MTINIFILHNNQFEKLKNWITLGTIVANSNDKFVNMHKIMI